jgi:hypothetical protein
MVYLYDNQANMIYRVGPALATAISAIGTAKGVDLTYSAVSRHVSGPSWGKPTIMAHESLHIMKCSMAMAYVGTTDRVHSSTALLGRTALEKRQPKPQEHSAKYTKPKSHTTFNEAF